MKALSYLKRLRAAYTTSTELPGLIQITDLPELDDVIEQLENYIQEADEILDTGRSLKGILAEVPKI